MTEPYATTQERWLALQRRDPKANSSFLYGVHSTHIYCRPTCPGRLARRSNVVFFDSLAHAHRAGYRPCKRCQPCNDAWDRGSQARATLRRARDLITAAAADSAPREQPWTVEGVAAELGVSGGHLHRLFRKQLNTTPKAFAAAAVAAAAAAAAATTAAGAGAAGAGLDPARTTRVQQRLRAPEEDLAVSPSLPSQARAGPGCEGSDASEPTPWWSAAPFGEEEEEEEDWAGTLLWLADSHAPGPFD